MVLTVKWSVDENLFWKETFDEWKLLYLSGKTPAISLSNKRKQELSANHYQNEAWTYSALTTERFQIILLCDVVFKLV